MGNVPQILAVVLFSLGSLSLSALLLTVNSYGNVSRHPVFVTFLRTWLLWSSFMLYVDLGALVTPAFKTDRNLIAFQTGLRDMLWISTRISTLNLVIHTWATMKIGRSNMSEQSEKKRTLILVATYLLCLVAVIEIIPISTHHVSDSKTIGLAVAYLCLALTIITLLLGVVLIVTFLRDRRILRQANLHGVMSIWMLMRLLVLCLYQLFMTIFGGVILAVPMKIPKDLTPAVQSIYPLLVFFSMGLRRDILHAWFPCWVARGDRPRPGELAHQLNFNLSVSVISNTGGSDRSLALSPGDQEKSASLGAVLRNGQ